MAPARVICNADIENHIMSKQPFKTPLILIVEDDELIKEVIRIALKKEKGWETVSVGCGPHAIEAWDHSEFDLIIMDLRLPLMSGIESARKIRELEKNSRRRHTPIIAFTALVDKQCRQECFDAGFDDFIPKPTKLKQLINTISKHITH
jgi:CheY-like chemotaxis protein